MNTYKTTLETERLILRQPATDDLEAFQSWCGNPENTRYMSFGPNSEEQTREWLSQAKPGKDFAVVLKETDAVIGSCGIYPKDNNYIGEVGWILHKDYWKRGYGTELGGELIRYGFEDLKLGRIQAPCAAINYGSYRIMERNGMRREALHRKAFWARVDKEWIDEAWYAILAEDYFTKSNPFTNKTTSVISKINLLESANNVDALFQYFEIGRLNGYTLNVLQAKNRTLEFHRHEQSDELFYVIEGSFELEFEDGLVLLNQGELIIVPKGVLHRPVCKELVKCLLIELDGTLTKENTGGTYGGG